jgi:hypothetical protein
LPYDPFSVGSTALAGNGTGVSTNSLDSFVQCGAQFSAEAINLSGIFGRKQLTKQGLDGIFQQYAPRTGTVACQTMQRTTVKCVGNPDEELAQSRAVSAMQRFVKNDVCFLFFPFVFLVLGGIVLEVAGDMRPLGGAQSHRRKFLTGNGLLAVNTRIQLSLFPHRRTPFFLRWEQITPMETNCPLAAMVRNWRQSRFVGGTRYKPRSVGSSERAAVG